MKLLSRQLIKRQANFSPRIYLRCGDVLEERGSAQRVGHPVTNTPDDHTLTANCVWNVSPFTLYTMRSCSPSLRVVPSYLISFTKDKAKIFSDLSLAVGGREEKREEARRWADGRSG